MSRGPRRRPRYRFRGRSPRARLRRGTTGLALSRLLAGVGRRRAPRGSPAWPATRSRTAPSGWSRLRADPCPRVRRSHASLDHEPDARHRSRPRSRRAAHTLLGAAAPQLVPNVGAAPPFAESCRCHRRQTESVVQLAIGEQTAVRGDPGAMNSSLIRRSKETRRAAGCLHPVASAIPGSLRRPYCSENYTRIRRCRSPKCRSQMGNGSPDRLVSVGEQPIVDCGPCRANRSFLDMPHFSLAKLSFVDLRELLGSEDAAPLAEVDQLQLVPRRGLRHAAPSCRP